MIKSDHLIGDVVALKLGGGVEERAHRRQVAQQDRIGRLVVACLLAELVGVL